MRGFSMRPERVRYCDRTSRKDMRWIIGDIHGMLRPLVTLVNEVRRHDHGARFIFVGDYVNRGPDAKGVIDFLMKLQNAHFIRGNHDDIFDLVINGHCYAENAARDDRVAAFLWFMKYGLDTTLMSYDCDYALLDSLTERCTVGLLDRMGESVPADHRQFIRQLPAAYEDDDLFIVHGKWDPDELTETPSLSARLEQNPKIRHRLLWGRFTDDEIARTKAWKRTGYFGHTPVSFYAAAFRGATKASGAAPNMVPVVGNKMVLLDTAAALGEDGRLTAYCPDIRSFIQADHFGKLVQSNAK
jgi:serine/threonine protein phosphatase 1